MNVLCNAGLRSRTTPTWRSQHDEMDMTLVVHGVKPCLAMSVDNGNLRPAFVLLECYQLSFVIWCDVTTAVSFLNILMSCALPSVTLLSFRILLGLLHRIFSSYWPYYCFHFNVAAGVVSFTCLKILKQNILGYTNFLRIGDNVCIITHMWPIRLRSGDIYCIYVRYTIWFIIFILIQWLFKVCRGKSASLYFSTNLFKISL